MLEKANYIVVEGLIGTGKRALAQRLAAHLEAQTLLENLDNPFFSRFCRQRERWALPTQLTFLFSRLDQISRYSSLERTVSDFMFDKDSLFAEQTLPADELALYWRIFEAMRPEDLPVPDLVIYLEASTQRLASRIKSSGTEIERQYITESYLSDLGERYARFFYEYDQSPIFTVDMDRFNPIEKQEDFQLLIKQLRNMRSYREFFGYGYSS